MSTDLLASTKAKLDQVSPSFCLAKWLQVTLQLYKGSTQSCHHVTPHRADVHEIKSDPFALHNSTKKLHVRQEMLNGEFPRECQYCWNIEKVGHASDRIHKSASDWALPFFDRAAAGIGEKTAPTFLEVAFDNVCNFKCAYCSPLYSTLWGQEIRTHGPYPTSGAYNDLEVLEQAHGKPLSPQERQRFIQAFWQWWPEIAPGLHHLRVTGGEPLLASETWKLMGLLECLDNPRLIFGVNTNLSLSDMQMDRFLGQLKKMSPQVSKTIIYCSIDSVGAQAEYIRHGLRFDRFEKNANRLLKEAPANTQISYMITVNALSLPGTKSLMQWISDQRTEFRDRQISIDTPYLRNPGFLSVLVLPQSYRHFLDEAVDEMSKAGFDQIETQRLLRIADLMTSNLMGFAEKSRLRRDFWKMLTVHDRRRGTDVRVAFPEYTGFFDVCSSISSLEQM